MHKMLKKKVLPLWATLILIVAIPVSAYFAGQMATNTISASSAVVWNPYIWIKFIDAEPFPSNPTPGINETFGLTLTHNSSNQHWEGNFYMTWIINVTKTGGGISADSVDFYFDYTYGDIVEMNSTLLADGTLQFTCHSATWIHETWWTNEYNHFIVNFNDAGSYDVTIYAITRSP